MFIYLLKLIYNIHLNKNLINNIQLYEFKFNKYSVYNLK